MGHGDQPLTQEGCAGSRGGMSPSLVGVQVSKVPCGSCSWGEKETQGGLMSRSAGQVAWGLGTASGISQTSESGWAPRGGCLVFVKMKESRNWQEHPNPAVGGHGPGVFLGKRAEERTCLHTHRHTCNTHTHTYTHVPTCTHMYTPPRPPLHPPTCTQPPQSRRTSPAARRFPFGLFKPREGGGEP